MDWIIKAIQQAWAYIKNLFSKIVNGILNFTQHIVGWFKGLRLRQGRDVPFIFNGKSPQFRELIKSAPVRDAGIFSKNAQMVQGVYNEETDEITHCEIIGADGLDAQTRNVMGREACVVLS